MKNIIELVRSAISTVWAWFIRRSPAMALVRLGVAVFLASAAGSYTLSGSYREAGTSVEVSLKTGDTLAVVTFVGLFLSALLIIGGLIWEMYRQRQEKKRLDRLRVIVIEQLSLKNAPTSPLSKALPGRFEGHVEEIMYDVRDRVIDNAITDPPAVLSEILSLKSDVVRRTAGRDRADVSVVYGGRMAVPFTFVTGVLLGDEGNITVFDWDRKPGGGWKELLEDDDHERFQISGLAQATTEQVVLAISVSYPIVASDIATAFSGLPVVTMQIPSQSSDLHWSMKKQGEWSMQVLQVFKTLAAQGVKRVHLILAAPNSVSFEFGRRHDEALLPDTVIYAYTKDRTPAYPWGIRIPRPGINQAEVIWAKASASVQ